MSGSGRESEKVVSLLRLIVELSLYVIASKTGTEVDEPASGMKGFPCCGIVCVTETFLQGRLTYSLYVRVQSAPYLDACKPSRSEESIRPQPQS